MTGKHEAQSERRGPVAWLIAKVGKVGALSLSLVVVMAVAAAALIIVRANISIIDATSGSADLSYSIDGLGQVDGVADVLFEEFDGLVWAANGIYGTANTLPPSVTCVATVSNGGDLTISTSGLLAGERCSWWLYVTNGSSMDVVNLTYDYGISGEFGAVGSGAPFEVYDLGGISGTGLLAGATAPAKLALAPTTNDGVTYSAADLGLTAEGSR